MAKSVLKYTCTLKRFEKVRKCKKEKKKVRKCEKKWGFKKLYIKTKSLKLTPNSPIVWVQRNYYFCKEQMHEYDVVC